MNSATNRQMHLGVFVLGTANHIAGWRTASAFTSRMQLSAKVMPPHAQRSSARNLKLLTTIVVWVLWP